MKPKSSFQECISIYFVARRYFCFYIWSCSVIVCWVFLQTNREHGPGMMYACELCFLFHESKVERWERNQLRCEEQNSVLLGVVWGMLLVWNSTNSSVVHAASELVKLQNTPMVVLCSLQNALTKSWESCAVSCSVQVESLQKKALYFSAQSHLREQVKYSCVTPCVNNHEKESKLLGIAQLSSICGTSVDGLTWVEGNWSSVHFVKRVFYQKQEMLDFFSSILYECVTQEKPEMLPTYIAIDQVK